MATSQIHIRVNFATEQQLREIRGVGHVLAHSIITLRNFQGNLDRDLLEIMLRGELDPSQINLLDFSRNAELPVRYHADSTHLPTPPVTNVPFTVHSAPGPVLPTLVGSVAVFCDPISYPTPDDVRNLRAQGMTVAVGLHPKNARGTSSKDIQALRRLVKMPEVVGFGEIGLDQTTPAPEWDDPIDVLCEIGRYIEKRHVVILHCRSNNQDPDFSIYRIMRHHLRQCSVPRHQKIHLHCFSGDKQAVKDWLEEYPNTYFGFTRLVDTFSSEQKEAVNCVNDTRLLLETDAPYFQFRRYRPQCGSNSTPALIGLTAVEVAQVRQTTWRQILKLTTANAQRLYCNQ